MVTAVMAVPEEKDLAEKDLADQDKDPEKVPMAVNPVPDKNKDKDSPSILYKSPLWTKTLASQRMVHLPMV